jgi:indolepyruvate ferredoxin oxidoreductase
MKSLRGTAFDLFGHNAHRRMERELVAWYRGIIEQVLDDLTKENAVRALEIAALPDQIRGYERIKEESIACVKELAEQMLAELRGRQTAAETVR